MTFCVPAARRARRWSPRQRRSSPLQRRALRSKGARSGWRPDVGAAAPGTLDGIAIHEGEVSTMSTPSIAIPAVAVRAGHAEEVDRYTCKAVLARPDLRGVGRGGSANGSSRWIVAPRLADTLSGAGDVPMMKALLICITGGLIWQFVLVLALVGREQRNVRWSTLREALWLRSPRSPLSGRTGGRSGCS